MQQGVTDLSNEVSRHKHDHNHANVQATESYILRTVFKFFKILTFSALRLGLHLIKNSKPHPEYIQRQYVV